jgi:hypothetical protein
MMTRSYGIGKGVLFAGVRDIRQLHAHIRYSNVDVSRVRLSKEASWRMPRNVLHA